MARSRNKFKGEVDSLAVQQAWQEEGQIEEVIEPSMPIIDPHHHVWDRNSRYLFDELLDDVDSGHNVKSTVFLQCGAMYRADGDPLYRPLGETEFVNGIAAMAASGLYGDVRLCEAIIGFADLRQGASVEGVLDQHVRVGGGRFRGVRHASNWDTDPDVKKMIRMPVPEKVLCEPKFREGYAKLGPLGLSFDVWTYYPQLKDVEDLADAFPGTTIIVDHVGGLLGIGKYANRRDEVFREWRKAIFDLAQHPNVMIKLGGLGMLSCGWDFHTRPQPPTSEQLATTWRPYLESCIEAFGPNRSMFESNVPVDKEPATPPSPSRARTSTPRRSARSSVCAMCSKARCSATPTGCASTRN
jgi:predicted TIM-barrel fold metal-dependent hydrolase